MDKEEYLLDKKRDLEERNARLTQNLGPVDQLELEDIHNVQEDEEEEDEENDDNGDHVFNFNVSDTDSGSEASHSEESFDFELGV